MEPNWDVPKLSHLEPFDHVREYVQKLHDLRIEPRKTSAKARGVDKDENIGYDVIDLRCLKFSSAGQVLVPGQGVLEMTPWSRQQLGSEMGVKWDKFFGDMNANQIQSAVMDHLRSRSAPSGLKKVIARKHEEEKASSSGILRAFVSPGYAEIPDIMLLDRMRDTIGHSQLSEMGFHRTKLTDKGSFLTLVFQDPVSLLGNQAKDENAYYGLRLRNSEVGAYSLVGDGYLLRLICVNGMVVGFTQDRWLYRRHRWIDSETLDGLLTHMFNNLIEGRDKIQRSNDALLDTPIEDPANELRAFLRRQQRPKKEQEAAVRALYEDIGMEMRDREDGDIGPLSAYHLAQGIARLGMASRNSPERQHEIELLAKNFVNQTLAANHPALLAA